MFGHYCYYTVKVGCKKCDNKRSVVQMSRSKKQNDSRTTFQ
jgi:hypothetical protein